MPRWARIAAVLLAPLLTLVLVLTPAPALAADKKELTPAQRYELGLRQMRRGYYTKALENFNRIRNYYRDDPISMKAELAIADVYFKKRDFEQSRLAYEDFSRLHPRHDDLDYVTFRIGMCLYQRAPKLAGRDQTATRQAVNVWAGFEARFPESSLYPEVSKLLGKGRNRLANREFFIAKYYAGEDAWLAVRRRLNSVLDRYPTTDKSDQVLTLLAQSYHRWGMIEEAKATRERLAAQYPDGNRRIARVDRILSRVPGTPPDEETFIRPYRMPGMGAAPGGP